MKENYELLPISKAFVLEILTQFGTSFAALYNLMTQKNTPLNSLKIILCYIVPLPLFQPSGADTSANPCQIGTSMSLYSIHNFKDK